MGLFLERIFQLNNLNNISPFLTAPSMGKQPTESHSDFRYGLGCSSYDWLNDSYMRDFANYRRVAHGSNLKLVPVDWYQRCHRNRHTNRYTIPIHCHACHKSPKHCENSFLLIVCVLNIPLLQSCRMDISHHN